jgi:hypothetical protein
MSKKDEKIARYEQALHELECAMWATGTVVQMMEQVRAIVRDARQIPESEQCRTGYEIKLRQWTGVIPNES